MTDLDNCPFCDSEQPALVQAEKHHPSKGDWAVLCTNFWCRAQTGWFPSAEEATSAWSRRDEMKRELRLLGDEVRYAPRMVHVSDGGELTFKTAEQQDQTKW